MAILPDKYAIVVPDKDYKEMRLSEKFCLWFRAGNKILNCCSMSAGWLKKVIKTGKI